MAGIRETAAHLIARHKIGVSAGAPIHLSGILDVGERDRLDLSSLQEYTTGAANVAGDLIRRADKLGICAFRCYGSTEHPTISSGVSGDPLDKRADTDGRLRPVPRYGLLTTTAKTCETDVKVKSSAAARNCSRLQRRAPDPLSIVDGWFRTGDIGRARRRRISHHHRPQEGHHRARRGEHLLQRGRGLRWAAIRRSPKCRSDRSPDDKYGERVCAFVVLNPGQQFGVAEAAEHFQECGLARQKTPERIVVVDELPRTASGKVQKHLLRDRLS